MPHLTRLAIARLAATHAIEIQCTQDDCAAVVVGPLPEEWLADPDTGDVLCPQHRAQAVWYDDRADGFDAEQVRAAVCHAVAIEMREYRIADDKLEGPPMTLFDQERAALFTAISDRAVGLLAPSLDGIDQSAPSVPTAVLRETSDPQRPGLIGDETLPMRPRGRR